MKDFDMTTITTTDHQRTPLIAALAAGAALVVGGAIGVAWEHNYNSPAETSSHATTQEKAFSGATTQQEMSGSTTGHLPKSASGSQRFGGATTSQEMSGSVGGHSEFTPFGAHLREELRR
jgi:hypothetical protein